jgi:hypothetical protein
MTTQKKAQLATLALVPFSNGETRGDPSAVLNPRREFGRKPIRAVCDR